MNDNVLVDSFSRKIEYLRLSVTSQCNFNCSYCPKSGDIYNTETVYLKRLIDIMISLGIKKIRLTGGEPLVREDIDKIISYITPKCQVGLTTNGYLLEDKLQLLIKAGLKRVNVSLDAVDDGLYNEITGHSKIGKVLKGIELARNNGLIVKLNCVLLQNSFAEQIKQLMEYSKKIGAVVCFIELMPFGDKNKTAVSFERVFEYIKNNYGDVKEEPKRDDSFIKGPSVYYSVGEYKFATIRSISNPFCSSCNRLRFTSKGILRSCLYYNDGVDILSMLKRGLGDDEIKATIFSLVKNKHKSHNFNISPADMNMREIGG